MFFDGKKDELRGKTESRKKPMYQGDNDKKNL